MEKYCNSCRKSFNDLKFQLCPYCGGKLDIRYGRQPIPRKLRHLVFKRDGYRCCECGASKEETSLEIDHIVPVAKGGTNDIDNLQTLCRECNRMKHTDEWVGGENNIEVANNELNNLNKQLKKNRINLKYAKTEDEKIEYQYNILKLNEEINNIKSNIDILKKEEQDKLKRKKENQDKLKLYKKLYVKLCDKKLYELNNEIGTNSLSNKSKDKILKYIISNNTIGKIECALSTIEEKEKKRIEKSKEEQRKQQEKSKEEQRKQQEKSKEEQRKQQIINKKLRKPRIKSQKQIRIDKQREEKRQEKLYEKYGTKICPKCGSKILKNALKCKYCNEYFKPKLSNNKRNNKPKKDKKIKLPKNNGIRTKNIWDGDNIFNKIYDESTKSHYVNERKKTCPHCKKRLVKKH